MDRRTFMGLTAAAAAGSLLSHTAFAQTVPKAKNVVLAHSLFADGSSWGAVAVSKDPAHRQNHPRGMAVKAELVRRVHGGSNHQP